MTHDHDQLPQSEASSPTSEPTLQTPRGKKRTLKDLSVEKMTTSRKMPRTEAQKSGDNEKKAECSVCHTPRSNDQRGSVCVTCMQSFRKLTGHQNVSKCKHDTELMQKVVSSSKSLREEKPGQRSRATADRQKLSTAKVLENLSDSEAYFHFDFKENVRYPMSKEETGDEWRAQNKLSLTVFGCTVHTPGRRNTHFLLVSEVLDHDSQMACLLLTYVLEAVQARSAYKWDKVRMLHLVCDCGPHFRSRESYAFFLAEVPKRWNINALWLSIF